LFEHVVVAMFGVSVIDLVVVVLGACAEEVCVGVDFFCVCVVVCDDWVEG